MDAAQLRTESLKPQLAFWSQRKTNPKCEVTVEILHVRSFYFIVSNTSIFNQLENGTNRPFEDTVEDKKRNDPLF